MLKRAPDVRRPLQPAVRGRLSQRPGGSCVSSHPRPARGDHDRHADGGGDAVDFRRGGASLRHRRSVSLSVLHPDSHFLGAGALHLHVRVDGEVRRRLRRAHRHPCRRRRAGQPAQAQSPQEGGAVRAVLRRAVHRRGRHHGPEVRHGALRHRSGVRRSRSAALDRVLRRAGRLLPDVLPVPAGRLGVLEDRRAAAPRRDPRRGHRTRRAGPASG